MQDPGGDEPNQGSEMLSVGGAGVGVVEVAQGGRLGTGGEVEEVEGDRLPAGLAELHGGAAPGELGQRRGQARSADGLQDDVERPGGHGDFGNHRGRALL